MPLLPGHKHNFTTLQRAFAAGDVALMECQLAATGESAAVICAANRLPRGEIEFVPIAQMFLGDPYEAVNPPRSEGGFHGQEEEQ